MNALSGSAAPRSQVSSSHYVRVRVQVRGRGILTLTQRLQVTSSAHVGKLAGHQLEAAPVTKAGGKMRTGAHVHAVRFGPRAFRPGIGQSRRPTPTWKAMEGCGRLWKVVESCGRLWEAVEGCGRLSVRIPVTSVRQRRREACGRRRRRRRRRQWRRRRWRRGRRRRRW